MIDDQDTPIIEEVKPVVRIDQQDIQSDAIKEKHLAQDSVGQDQLQTDSVGSDQIQDGAVGSAQIASGAITETNITLADVTTLDVSTTKHGLVPKAPNDTAKHLIGDGSWAYGPSGALGYASSTSNFTLSSSQTTATLVTSLSVTVTIPAGSRYVKITAFSFSIQPSGGGTGAFAIWDGTVGSGTLLSFSNCTGANDFSITQAIVTPSAGSKTYNVSIKNSSLNNIVVNGDATAPAFILVEGL